MHTLSENVNTDFTLSDFIRPDGRGTRAFESFHHASGWCKDRWGIPRQITPCVLMENGKIDIAKIEAARRY